MTAARKSSEASTLGSVSKSWHKTTAVDGLVGARPVVIDYGFISEGGADHGARYFATWENRTADVDWAECVVRLCEAVEYLRDTPGPADSDLAQGALSKSKLGRLCICGHWGGAHRMGWCPDCKCRNIITPPEALPSDSGLGGQESTDAQSNQSKGGRKNE